MKVTSPSKGSQARLYFQKTSSSSFATCQMKEFDPSKVLQDRRKSSPREVSFVVSKDEILGEKILPFYILAITL